MTRLAELKQRLTEADPAFSEAYRQADGEYALIEMMVRARTGAKLTQAEVAERMGTRQPSIARLESGAVSPTIATVRRYLAAVGQDLRISVRPLARSAARPRTTGRATARASRDDG
jgi:transcriptional regulator with XRE-family HTH domain